MAKILLVNFEIGQGLRLATFLRVERHDVRVAESSVASLRGPQRVTDFDLVIVDASLREQSVRDLVTEIATQRASSGPRPMVLCICRCYRGARFELDLERRGARVVYV